jgi:uncharacterized protein
MVFMRFSIDVIFMDGNDCVTGLVQEIHPFCFSPIFWKAIKAVECPAGTVAKKNVSLSDRLAIEDE